ncbi:hypothetical protein [Clostridium estertheticum]|uniref:Transporter n=1 Tax=Clostridium estertheticum subsp. estertheticum TaxID=1552 RepID=A0A1J0GCI1_9CLOT|nr:hypothetical protein [Clostridium estertheticum]APC39039.1 hypothetical protein A7L45_02625 [Clostridium estertheticum subsp. estertheticum]MBZ9615002.1 hypothetical protein [Clostridium estertheticum subsp. laramiense]WAG74907.1 hypothetical protein LL032_05470 [Clostridium estertheticum]
MYIDEDAIKSFSLNNTYEQESQYFPLSCPYRQMNPFPPFPQGGPQSGPQGGPSSGRPPSSAPNFTPPEPKVQQFGATPLIDQGAIRPCLRRFVYIWPKRGRGFWAWLTFVGPRSVSGFRWYRNTWRYFGMDLREISSFQCF